MKIRQKLAVGGLGALILIAVVVFILNYTAPPESGSGPAVTSVVIRTPLPAPTLSAPTIERLTPTEWTSAGSRATSYADALQGTGFYTATDGIACLGQSAPDGPHLPDYIIGRLYIGWDTSTLRADPQHPPSVTMIIDLPWTVGWEDPPYISVYRRSDDLASGWEAAPEDEIARWQLPAFTGRMIEGPQGKTFYAMEKPPEIKVPLPASAINWSGTTRLELRHAREGVPPARYEQICLGTADVQLEVER